MGDLPLMGIPIVEEPLMEDGQIVMLGATPWSCEVLLVGTGPISWRTGARREAERIFRTGLADVLEWPGEPPYREPVSGRKILDRLRAGADVVLLDPEDGGTAGHCGCCAHSRASGCGGRGCPCWERTP